MPHPTPIQRLVADLHSLAERERQWPFTVQIPRNRAAEFSSMSAEEWRAFALGMSPAEITERLERGVTALDGVEIAGVRLVVAESEEGDCEEVRSVDDYS